MAYGIDQANNVASQLEKFTTSFAEHLAGQVANLDFWLEEVAHALRVLDGYPTRFSRLRAAQEAWVKTHGPVATSFCPHCGGKCELGETPRPPRRVPSGELDEARRRLKDATYRLLLRCHRARMVDEATLRAACQRVGTSVDPADLLDGSQ